MKICEKDMPLVRAFVEREAHDFTPNRDVAWIEGVVNLIIDKVDKIKEEEANYLYIYSCGNTGCIIREVMVDIMTDRRDINKRKDYCIRLCPCGNLSHTAFLEERD